MSDIEDLDQDLLGDDSAPKGWDSAPSGGGGGASKPEPLDVETPTHGRRRGGKPNKFESNNDKFESIDQIKDISEIPDIQEEVADDITTKVAAAPNVISAKVQGLQELDHDIMFQLPTAAGGIDLSCLTQFLAPQEKVAELDVLWDFDSLFTEVSSVMIQEQEDAEKAAAEAEEEKNKADEEKAKAAATS